MSEERMFELRNALSKVQESYLRERGWTKADVSIRGAGVTGEELEYLQRLIPYISYDEVTRGR